MNIFGIASKNSQENRKDKQKEVGKKNCNVQLKPKKNSSSATNIERTIFSTFLHDLCQEVYESKYKWHTVMYIIIQ